MQRYRSEVCQDVVVHRFHSTFGITVQFGYSALTHREHIPYCNLVVEEFPAALEHKRWHLNRGSQGLDGPLESSQRPFSYGGPGARTP
jgi:hypothetical protein